jgi:hypothetical protein
MLRATLILTLAGALALGAGASVAKPKKPKTPPATAAAPASAAPSKPVEPPKPVVPTLASLIATSDADVKVKLGVPDITHREEKSAMWTYAWPDCALMVFFKSEDGRVFRVSGAAAGPRRRAQQPPTVDACLAENHDKPPKQDEGAIDALLAAPQ